MSITNINTFQGRENISSLTEKYLIEALANLGQRYSIKGDGIYTSSITIKDILGIDNIDESSLENYTIKVDYNENQSEIDFLLYNIDTKMLEGSSWSYETTPIITIVENNYSIKANELDIQTISNSHIYSTGSKFIFSSVETTSEYSRFVCEKYDRASNTLDTGLIVFPKSGTYNLFSYDHIVLFLQKNSNLEYSLFIFYLNCSNLPFIIDHGISTDQSATSDNFINKLGEHSTSIIQSSENETTTFSPESFLTDIYALSESNNNYFLASDYNNPGIKITYIPETNSYNIITELHNDTSWILRELQSFAYEKTYIYQSFKKTYSQQKFLNSSNNSSYSYLFIEILKSLFISVYNGNPLYIPLTYQFNFSGNDSNPWQVYFSNSDIILRDVVQMNKGLWFTIKSFQDNTGILRINTTDIEKTSFYEYEINYDNEDSTIIYNISVQKHFTMPYISSNGYWVIDDIETEIYARGKDAGNPNIITIESIHGQDTPNILTMSNTEYFESLNWITKTAKIELPKQIIRQGDSVFSIDALTEEQIQNYNPYITKENSIISFECQYLVPTLSNIPKKKLEEYIDKLQYSIIFNISTTQNIVGYSNQDFEWTNEYYNEFKSLFDNIYGDNGVLVTLWVLKEDLTSPAGYSFQPIENRLGTSIDANYLTNFINTIGWVISNYTPTDPDNFTFSQIVFDNANYTIKQSEDSGRRVYPVIKNYAIPDYVNNNADDKRTNNFNLSIEFNDNIGGSYYAAIDNDYIFGEKAGNSYFKLINSVDQSLYRFFKEWKDNTSASTKVSTIYSYQVSDHQEDYSEYVPGTMSLSVPTLDLSEVFIKDLNSINKTNIVSFDKNSTPYYSYIGTSYNTDDKSILTIGTSTTNINIGTKTLVDNTTSVEFSKQRQLNIDFDNTQISSYAYINNDLIAKKDIITYGTTWRRFDINSISYWTTTFRQTGIFNQNYAILNNATTNIDKLYLNKSYEFIAATVKEKYPDNDNANMPFDLYVFDLVSIPKLIQTISPTLNLENITVDSRNNEVISYVLNNEESYLGVRMNSTMLGDLFEYSITSGSSEPISTISNPALTTIFTSNLLEITYYIGNDNKAHFTINDLDNSNYMTYVHKIQQQYIL